MKETRFAIVVGHTVSKKAVIRNRLRRRLREIVRMRLPHLVPGFDVVLIVRSPAIKKTFAELARGLDFVLARGGLVSPRRPKQNQVR